MHNHPKLWRRLPVGGSTRDKIFEKFIPPTFAAKKGRRVGIKLSSWARHVASKPSFEFPTKIEQDVGFAKGSLSYLFGFKGTTQTQVFLNEDFLAKTDFELCLPSDSFYQRLNYTDQPAYEWVYLGMKPIIGPVVHPYVFDVGHDGKGPVLLLMKAFHDYPWRPDSLWSFRLRQK